MRLLSSTHFFSKLTFSKILSETLLECQMVWIQIRTVILSVLIWVQNVCKGYQQTTKFPASKERVNEYPNHMLLWEIWKLTHYKPQVDLSAPISIFPKRGSIGDARGIRQQTNPNPRESDTAPIHWGGKLDTSSGISISNYITNMMAPSTGF